MFVIYIKNNNILMLMWILFSIKDILPHNMTNKLAIKLGPYFKANMCEVDIDKKRLIKVQFEEL